MEHEADIMPLKGEFLMAMPTLQDPNFFKTVVCICEDTSNGAMGVIINRQHAALTAKTIFKELKMDYLPETADHPIYIGGPVNTGEVFVLHGPPFDWIGCLRVNSWLALSNTRDVLEAIAAGRGPEPFLIVLGCSGWGNGQLDMEMKENCWLTCPADKRIIFDIPAKERWAEGLKLIHIDPAFFPGTPGRA
jgi:putative transcriptional regulator